MDYLQKLFFYDCVWDNDKIIYPAINNNILCETNIVTGETKIIEIFDEINKECLFVGIYKWNKYFILSSFYAKSALTFFDMESEEYIYINVDEEKHKWLNFREEDIIVFNKYIYIFSIELVIMKVDIEQKKIEYLFYPNIKPGDDFRGKIVKLYNKIYVSIRHSDLLYKFDLENEHMDIIDLNLNIKGINTLCFDGQLFWMTGAEKKIYSWNENSSENISYCEFPEKFEKIFGGESKECFWFANSFVYNECIYFVPGYANMLLEFDKKNGIFKEIIITDEEETEKSIGRKGRVSTAKYVVSKQKENILMLLSARNKNLILVNLENKKIEKINIFFQSKKELDKLFKINNKLDIDNLAYLITYMKERRISKIDKKEKNKGKEIYLKLIEKLILH